MVQVENLHPLIWRHSLRIGRPFDLTELNGRAWQFRVRGIWGRQYAYEELTAFNFCPLPCYALSGLVVALTTFPPAKPGADMFRPFGAKNWLD